MTEKFSTAPGSAEAGPENGKAAPEPAGRTSPRGLLTRIFFSRQTDVDQQIDDAERRQDRPDGKQVRITGGEEMDLPDIGLEYEDFEQFNEGGQAVIYRARDRFLKRTVALKTLKSSDHDDPVLRRNFIREAQLASQLDHPSIVPVYALAGDADHGMHMVMKLIRGKTLKDRLHRIVKRYSRMGVQSFDEKKSLHFRLDLFLKVCDAIAYAHSKNIMHCDLKPENIMVGEYHEAYVMDWGISQSLMETSGDDAPRDTISGTPKYISPEAVRGEKVDKRADVFSLGLILFEIVTLNQAAVGTETKEILVNIRDGILHPVRHRFGCRIAPDLCAIVRKALRNDRNTRYQSVDDLAEDIRRYLVGMEVSANPQHFFGKAFRSACRHAPTVVTVSLLILLGGVSIGAWNAYQLYTASENKNLRNILVSNAYNRIQENALTVDRMALSAKKSVENVADSAAFLLKNGQNFPTDSIFSPAPFDSPEGKDDGEEKEEAEIVFDRFSCHVLPGTKKSVEKGVIAKLPPLLSSLQRAAFSDVSGEDREAGTCDAETSFRWVSLGFSDGVYFCYPGVSRFPDGYDPRTRPWYQAAESAGGTVWSEPFFDLKGGEWKIACASPFRNPDGTFAGVAGIDFSLGRLAALIRGAGNDSACVKDKMLLAEDGTILIGKVNNGIYSGRKNRNAKLRKFRPNSVWIVIRRGEIGFTFEWEYGSPVLYLFTRLHSFPGYYVEKIDFNRMCDLYRENAGVNGRENPKGGF